MMDRRRFLIATAAAAPVTVFLTRPAVAAEPPVFATDRIAINGYDPVAYFTEGSPMQGSPDFRSEWMGATFLFASSENKEMFDADPNAFAPQYGGYCAYAVSRGYTASTDPFAWAVHDNKLYLNYSKSVRALWNLNRTKHIQSANANWPDVLDG